MIAQYIVCTRRGAGLGVVHAHTAREALDEYARTLGHEDAGAMWAELGPWTGRLFRVQPGCTREEDPNE